MIRKIEWRATQVDWLIGTLVDWVKESGGNVTSRQGLEKPGWEAGKLGGYKAGKIGGWEAWMLFVEAGSGCDVCQLYVTSKRRTRVTANQLIDENASDELNDQNDLNHPNEN